ncbi:thiamine phosphate synthase [uncultured Desulfobulbus sp.]|uniref:thiamine phosphate synthase n=1 Tax=uncultured Desulfobulbus sp. TaxID=239745 RepID=UPI00262772F8|nr:thiamine phosphate synthase [uncultured Desulfobulbus sp.]
MFDYSLYLVTDRRLSLGRSTVEVVAAAVSGGVTCVQLREKHCSTREFLEEARRVRELLVGTGVPLIINDRLDVALAVAADGVHLGQNDMHISDARRLVGERLVIGISAESVADAIRAEAEGADYIGVSPVFTTPTKMDTAPPLGLEGLREIRRAVSLPLVAIGSIRHDNAAEVLRAGADGLAVVSAIVSAPCPRTAAAALRQQIAFTREEERSCTKKSTITGS